MHSSASFFEIIKTNRVYLFLVSLFILIGTVYRFTIEKGDLIKDFAIDRNETIDRFFYWGTKLGEEPVYLVALLILIFIRFKEALFIPILGLYATIISNVLKAIFHQPRPGYAFWLEVDQKILLPVAGVEPLVAFNSFPSGHTISAFLFYGFLALIVKRKAWSLLFFCFAAITGFSRIVLFQHFLEDVIAGAFVGTLSAILFVWILNKIPGDESLAGEKEKKWYNKNVLNLIRKKRVHA